MKLSVEEILDGNKLIAEFMGRCGKYNKHLYWVNVPNIMWVTIEEMKFHLSMDWLDAVIEKIETTHDSDYWIVHSTYFSRREVAIKAEKNRRFKDIHIYVGEYSKLECSWLACVEFIKWYNEQEEK